MADARARHVAYLAGAVLLVAVAVQTSDVATVRWREIDGIPGFEYPVLARLLFVAERWVAGSRTGIALVNAAVAVAAVAAVTWVLRRAGADVALWLAAPTLLLAAVNIDAVTALGIAAALLAAARQRPAAAGFLAGAGAAFRIVPAVLLGPLLAAGGWAGRARLAATAAGVWLAVNLPYALTRPEQWWFPYRFARARGDIKGSLWAALGLGVDAANAASLFATAGIVAALTAGVATGRLRLPAAAALALLGFMAAGKLWQPHYLLWALPPLAMAQVPHRPVRALEVANLAYFLVIWRQLDPEAEAPWLWLSAGARYLALAWVVAAVLAGERAARRAPAAAQPTLA